MSQRGDDNVVADPGAAVGGDEFADLPELRDAVPPQEGSVEDVTPTGAARMDRGDDEDDEDICAGHDLDEEEQELAENLRRQVEEATGETPSLSVNEERSCVKSKKVKVKPE